MPRLLIVALSTALIFRAAFVPALAGTNEPLSQNWVGELKIGSSSRFVQMRLDSDRQPAAGTIGFPASGPTGIPLSAVSVESGHIKFTWAEDSGQTQFEGRLSAGLLDGIVQTGAQQGMLQLAPTGTLSDEAQQQLVGYYEMQPGHLLSISTFPTGNIYVDYSTGRL